MRYIQSAVIGGAAALLLHLPPEISRFVAAVALALFLGELVFPRLVVIFYQDIEERRQREADKLVREKYYKEVER